MIKNDPEIIPNVSKNIKSHNIQYDFISPHPKCGVLVFLAHLHSFLLLHPPPPSSALTLTQHKLAQHTLTQHTFTQYTQSHSTDTVTQHTLTQHTLTQHTHSRSFVPGRFSRELLRFCS